MQSPKFSVVIPAYNQAEFLGEAIESVLNQTYPDFEVIVVNDASPDQTSEVVKHFKDVRIRQIVHPENRGLPAARNTGMKASSGEFIVLLDADDYFHPQKLEEHLRFYAAHPEVGITYNARFDLHHSSNKIHDIYSPPATVRLIDFVLGFPFSPSDMVIRREAAAQIAFFDERMRCGGEDLDFFCRLALEGFGMARVNGVLNYRRYHAGRQKKKLRCRLDDYNRALDNIFEGSWCPPEVLNVRKLAYANHYTEVACWALAQGEVDLGNEIIQEILLLGPSACAADSVFPSKVAEALFKYSVQDQSLDHEKVLFSVFNSLPAALAVSVDKTNELIARGYLHRATQSALWGDEALAHTYFERAASLGVEADTLYRRQVAAQLANYEAELGPENTASMARQLFTQLEHIGASGCVRQIKGQLFADKAFSNYRSGDYIKTLFSVVQAISNDPHYMTNRGIISITARSLLNNAKLGLGF